MIDCGPTTTQALKREAHRISINTLDVIYVTHLHGDHINGLPVLLLELNFGQQRQRPLWIIGPPTTRVRIEKLCETSYPTMLSALISYPIHFLEHPLDHEGTLGGRHLKSIAAEHDPAAYPTSLRLTDSAGRSLAFSGDTGWNQGLISLSAHNDIFVLECSYAMSCFAGHLSLDKISEVRSRLTPTRLILTHLGVEARSAALSRQEELMIEVADDGAQWMIEPSSD
jgi:ribonuclease BN (tRNA processing enzyme)